MTSERPAREFKLQPEPLSKTETVGRVKGREEGNEIELHLGRRQAHRGEEVHSRRWSFQQPRCWATCVTRPLPNPEVTKAFGVPLPTRGSTSQGQK